MPFSLFPLCTNRSSSLHAKQPEFLVHVSKQWKIINLPFAAPVLTAHLYPGPPCPLLMTSARFSCLPPDTAQDTAQGTGILHRE